MEPKTLPKHILKTIAKKDANKESKTRTTGPFLRCQKSEICSWRLKKIKKVPKRCPKTTRHIDKIDFWSSKVPPRPPRASKAQKVTPGARKMSPNDPPRLPNEHQNLPQWLQKTTSDIDKTDFFRNLYLAKPMFETCNSGPAECA